MGRVRAQAYAALAWVRERPLIAIAAALAATSLCFILVSMTKTPRDDREWVEHLSVLPAAMIDEESGAWSVSPVRDWSYEPSGPLRRDRTA
ncbi:MAG: hypothetical protein AAF719_10825, partial [Pseudomonadota bacterium]